jgi:predicted MFS family arabinose efflux permease
VSRRGVFGGLCGLVFLLNLGRVLFAPLLEPLRASFGLTASTAGLLATLVWLGSGLPRVPVGIVLTRVSRHRVVLATGAWLAGSAALTASATTPGTLLLGGFLLGLSTGAYFIAANPLVSELFPERVGRALGIHGAAAQSAAVLAPVLAGVAVGAGSWRYALWLVAGGAAVGTLLLAWQGRHTPMPSAGDADRHFLRAAREQWPLILTGIALFGVTGFVWNGVFNFYVTYVTDVKGLSPELGRTLLTVVFAAGVPAFWLAGRVADRVSTLPFVLAIVATFASSLVALTVVQGFWPLVAVSVCMGFVIHGIFPAMDTYLLGGLPDRHRSSAYATYSGVVMLVGALGSVTVGTLTDAGVPFDTVYHLFVVAIGGTLIVMTTLFARSHLPAVPTGGME